jgi:hypothetical protein
MGDRVATSWVRDGPCRVFSWEPRASTAVAADSGGSFQTCGLIYTAEVWTAGGATVTGAHVLYICDD